MQLIKVNYMVYVIEDKNFGQENYLRFYILFAGNRMRNTYLRIIASNKTVICSEAIFRQVQLPCSRYKDKH